MTALAVPPLDGEPWPTLGPQVCSLIEERAVFGPGSLKGRPAKLDAEKRAAVYRAYEVYPKGHVLEGRRRFKRVQISWRKGTAKTEWAAWIGFAELHPEGPVRFDGWDAYGQPVGRPVADPYIPMLAYTEEQVEKLAFGALYVICSEGPDADLFDIGLDRIIRLDERGRADGQAEPVAGSPSALDGARTTWQHFDEPHRMTSPRLVQAHETMIANLPKRPLEDPWSLGTTTAGALGQGSVAEQYHLEAQKIAAGEVDDPELFYFHREASQGHDLDTLEGRIEAVAEATGPTGEYAPGQFRDIARQWDRPKADHAYLERVWLNRWVAAGAAAFDVEKWRQPDRVKGKVPKGALIAAGFDGARFRDATAIVITDVETGRQQLIGLWERPEHEEQWEVPERDVTAVVSKMMRDYQVWRFYCDPPHWTSTIGDWSQRWPDQVVEWWTTRRQPMAYAVRAYREAIETGAVTHDGDERFDRHIAAAGRRDIEMYDDEGNRLFLLCKQHDDMKFDAAMAGCLSWRAYLDAQGKGVKRRRKSTPQKVR